MQKPAETDFPLLPAIGDRWSPRAFADRPVADEILGSLFEAARWAPSSSNSQPWRYLVGRKGMDSMHATIAACLAANNQKWAPRAPVLLLSVARMRKEAGAEPSRIALHDTGLANAQFAAQATALGLVVHFMGGFDADKARATLAIDELHDPVVAIALGYQGDLVELPEDLQQRELAARARNPLAGIAFTDRIGGRPLFEAKPGS